MSDAGDESFEELRKLSPSDRDESKQTIDETKAQVADSDPKRTSLMVSQGHETKCPQCGYQWDNNLSNLPLRPGEDVNQGWVAYLRQKFSALFHFFLVFLWWRDTNKTVKVHLQVTSQSTGAVDAIVQKLKKMLLPTKMSVEANWQECDIIIIFCPVVSRVGSDVEAAMKNPSVSSGGKAVILVVMYHSRDVNFSTDVEEWSKEYKNIKLAVHVLFHETQPGLLTCEKNDQAVSKIQEMLSEHSK